MNKEVCDPARMQNKGIIVKVYLHKGRKDISGVLTEQKIINFCNWTLCKSLNNNDYVTESQYIGNTKIGVKGFTN